MYIMSAKLECQSLSFENFVGTSSASLIFAITFLKMVTNHNLIVCKMMKSVPGSKQTVVNAYYKVIES